MATLCEFGTVPDQIKDGFKMVGIITSTEKEILATYSKDNFRIVPGLVYVDGKTCDFAIMQSK